VRDFPPETLPYIHNLARIADLVGIYAKMDDKQKDFLDELGPLNIEARYPKAKNRLFSRMTPKYSTDLLKETEELIEWLKQN